ncbi:MAG: NAD(P)H-dependent oxidoreductase subunit E [Alphaproteobacteria bacterium]
MTTVAITPMNSQHHTGQTPKALGLNLKWDKAENAKIKRICSRYPADRQQSAMIPLLKLAQDKCNGWLPVDAMQLVAETLQLPYMRVYEVATFYTMFNLNSVGQFHVQVCTNCSCLIRGSDGVLEAAKKVAEGAKKGTFTVTEVECLGACVAAPMMQIGMHYYTHLDAKQTEKILKHLAKGGDAKDFADTPPSDTDALHGGDYEERI